MVILHKFIPAWGTPDLSPFCVKTEVYLRIAGLAYETKTADTRKAPKGKLPYVVDDAGQVVSDSRQIIAHFEAKLPVPVDAGLTAQERATSVAFRALLEEESYFYMVRLRWQCEAGFRIYRPVLTAYLEKLGIPSWLAPLVALAVRRQMVRTAYAQGAGRHTDDEIEARLCEILEALSTQLGDGPYFLGERPRTLDATTFAFLWALCAAPFESRSRSMALSDPKLTAYCERMHQRYFGSATDGARAADSAA